MSSSKSVQKQAEADAAEYAAAYMAYGEGAGTRRKLIEGTVDYSMKFRPGYREAFEAAHDKQDMAKHADKARKDNRRREVTAAAERNAKALVTGNHKNADLKVLAVIGLAAVAHKTGADKKAWDLTKRKFAKIKSRYTKPADTYKAEPDADGVYNVTNIR